jgi:hypothetical protein
MKIKFLFILSVSLIAFNAFAQNTFRYQAVARDSAGNVIANQLIGVQISIILNDINDAPIYVEMHQPSSNAYGVINLDIGDGIPTTGDFSTINWSQTSFVKIEMDVMGGTDYTVSTTSEILSVPRALYAERAGSATDSKFGLYVTDFGAKGDSYTDDTDAFEAAIDSARILGAKLFIPNGIYRLTRTLVLENGVSLIGESRGSDPLQTPYNGSLLRYEGTGYALKITGHTVRVSDLVLRDISSGQSNGGILVLGDGELIENTNIENVLISGFVSGTGLRVEAKNNGGVAYAKFQNVRVRHGKIGFHIIQTNNGFVNSNNWQSCQISGGGFDYGILLDGGNNNAFTSVVIEPPSTTYGHLYVNSGQLNGHEIRIEGNTQAAGVPLIYFATGTRNSIITGVYAGGLTLDKGNNFVNMGSGKAIAYRNSVTNKFKNAVFFTPNGTSILDWDITGNGVSVSVLSPQLTDAHNVLKLTIPAGIVMRLEPSVLARPVVKELALFDQVNFGFHVKSTQPNIAYTATNAPLGWAASTAHSGSGAWEFVGMNAQVNRSAQSQFRFEVNNTTGGTITIYVTTPTLVFGNQLPTLDEAPLSTAGGTLVGQLTYAMATVTTPSNGFLTLPRSANYFEITNNSTISRINHLTADRVPKGTVITLLFNVAGTNVSNGGYLILKGGFTSVANSSLTLISNGNGTWREVDRNN